MSTREKDDEFISAPTSCIDALPIYQLSVSVSTINTLLERISSRCKLKPKMSFFYFIKLDF
jgi:hypothetical protein